MSAAPDEIQGREAAARAAIKNVFGTASDEDGVTLFVSHHLEELDADYWSRHLSVPSPVPERVLDLLMLRSHWGGDDEIEYFDFTLPDNVTDYVISVQFDNDGKVSGINMES